MTEKEAYENVLRELRKAKAPSLHLEDYNYWMNKGIQEYINERYNKFQTTQQLSDDLQALLVSSTINFTPTGLNTYSGAYTGQFSDPSVTVTTGQRYNSDFFRFKAPDDYWHMLGVHTVAVTTRPYKCHPTGYSVGMPAKRLTQDIAVGIINNSFLKPAFNRPYFSFSDGSGGNVKPDLLVFVGSLSNFGVSSVSLDYLKEPAQVNLTIQQRDLPIDTSAVLEFPEYVCREIIKRVVKLALEVSSDPRLKTNPPTNTTIP